MRGILLPNSWIAAAFLLYVFCLWMSARFGEAATVNVVSVSVSNPRQNRVARLSANSNVYTSLRRALSVRCGGVHNEEEKKKKEKEEVGKDNIEHCMTTVTQHETLAQPAPGTPFHYAFPVHDLNVAKHFYGEQLGCVEGRSSSKWQDYSLFGHQIVCHYVGDNYRCIDYYNPVDGDEVPVPHAGLALTVDEFHVLAERLRRSGIAFIIEPHLRFQGMPGEQYTMFFKDPSGNNLEFKAMTKPGNLFAKYNVADE